MTNPPPPSDPAAEPGLWEGIWTIPNALSVLRLVLVPVFLWLLLGVDSPGWAFWTLFVSGWSDFLDGKLARLLDQSSRLGALLDPAADRLYMIVVPIGLGIAGIVPWWFIGVLIARDGLLLLLGPLLNSRGLTALPVLYVGKAATFALMSGLPLILAGETHNIAGDIVRPIGWAFAIWGLYLYLYSFALYWWQTVLVVRHLPRTGARHIPPVESGKGAPAHRISSTNVDVEKDNHE